MEPISPMQKIPYKQRVSIRIDSDTSKKLKRICQQTDHATNSYVIAHLIDQYYWEHCVDEKGHEHDLRKKNDN